MFSGAFQQYLVYQVQKIRLQVTFIHFRVNCPFSFFYFYFLFLFFIFFYNCALEEHMHVDLIL